MSKLRDMKQLSEHDAGDFHDFTGEDFFVCDVYGARFYDAVFGQYQAQ